MSAEMEQGQAAQAILAPTTQAVSFFPGLYLFTVRTASPKPAAGAGGILLPALQVGVSPGSPAGLVEFVGLPGANSVWLINVGDSAVVRVHGESAVVLLNSIRVAGDTQAFDIQVDRLDSQVVAQSPTAAAAAASLKLKIGLHLLRQGDVEFVDSDWAGRAGSGAWVESFSINPLEGIRPTELEYKGLSANGFETPWMQAGVSCGTKGMNIPLIGFAIRLKAAAASRYECEYSAIFRSGALLGPFRNGIPCRSKSPNDPIDAIQVRIVQRESSSAGAKNAASAAASGRVAAKGPKFGKLRETAAKSAKSGVKAKKAASKTSKKNAKNVAKPASGKLLKKPVGKKAKGVTAGKVTLAKTAKTAKLVKAPPKKAKKKSK